MNHKTTTHQLLLFALLWSLLTGCQPGPTEVVPSTVEKTAITLAISTATVEPSATPVPPTETPTPTSEPTTAPLSADGPWLVYLQDYGAGEGAGPTFALVNPDGSSSSPIVPQRDAFAFFTTGDNSFNRLASINGSLYLFNPASSTALKINNYNGDAENSLLASIYQVGTNAPELLLYELPLGIIKAQIELVKCPTQSKGCEANGALYSDMGFQQPQWSPNGRYLAFAGVVESTSSDLYVYDSKDGSLRQLTNGPDWVGKLWWSPDGRWIIMEEIVMPWNDDLKQESMFYLGSSVGPSSVWAVSVSDNEIRRLDAITDPLGGNILGWQDDTKFLFFEGGMLRPAYFPQPGYRLRSIDSISGDIKMLYEGEMSWASFYPETGQVFVQSWGSDYVLISAATGKTKSIGSSNPSGWDQQLELYITGSACPEDANKVQAFNINGKFTCISPSIPTDEKKTQFPAPDGGWTVFIKDGVWLEGNGQPAIQISLETASDIIWCPDSNCFFLLVPIQNTRRATLYHVSLPDLTTQVIYDKIWLPFGYQWLRGK